MLRSILVAALIMGGAYALTSNYVFYNKAGSDYVKKIREERKSIRAGSGYHTSVGRGSGSFRKGK